MIKIIKIEVAGPSSLMLSFSDGSRGRWSAETILTRDTILTQPLADPAYFARAFIESGALAWPNGLELAPWSLHADLSAAGLLSAKPHSLTSPALRVPLSTFATFAPSRENQSRNLCALSVSA